MSGERIVNELILRLREKDMINTDLIEVGDYVNGTIVTKVVLDSIECNYIELDYSYNKRGIRNKDIKTVITHEQMEAMQYRVEE